MKAQYLIVFLIGFVCIPMNAQKKKDKCTEEDFRAKKQAYMTKKAGLTEEESKNFFPLYFQLQDKKKEINKEAWDDARKGKIPQTNEQEYKAIIDKFFSSQQQLLDLEKQHIDKYREVLPDSKIYMIYWAEIKFNRNMMKILQELKEKKKE